MTPARAARPHPALRAAAGTGRRPGPAPRPGDRHPAQRQRRCLPQPDRPAGYQPQDRRPLHRGGPPQTRGPYGAAPPRRHPQLPEADTKFPSDRQTVEVAYKLSPEHRALFDDVLAYVRGQVQDTSGSKRDQRVRWWSALSLLRALASSPAAAAATLRTRAVADDAEIGRRRREARPGRGAGPGRGRRRRRHRRRARLPAAMPWTKRPGTNVSSMRSSRQRGSSRPTPGRTPSFSSWSSASERSLPTATTPSSSAASSPPPTTSPSTCGTAGKKKFDVEVVTGELPPEERAARIAAQAERAGDTPKVLVATDCLSEGVNLQDGFQAVVHYDLAWNPTRHEQREGRVDRFGQPRTSSAPSPSTARTTASTASCWTSCSASTRASAGTWASASPSRPRSDQVLSALLEGILMRGKNGDQLELFEPRPRKPRNWS